MVKIIKELFLKVAPFKVRGMFKFFLLIGLMSILGFIDSAIAGRYKTLCLENSEKGLNYLKSKCLRLETQKDTERFILRLKTYLNEENKRLGFLDIDFSKKIGSKADNDPRASKENQRLRDLYLYLAQVEAPLKKLTPHFAFSRMRTERALEERGSITNLDRAAPFLTIDEGVLLYQFSQKLRKAAIKDLEKPLRFEDFSSWAYSIEDQVKKQERKHFPNPIHTIGLDQLHTTGAKGQGAVIAIIESGFPALEPTPTLNFGEEQDMPPLQAQQEKQIQDGIQEISPGFKGIIKPIVSFEKGASSYSSHGNWVLETVMKSAPEATILPIVAKSEEDIASALKFLSEQSSVNIINMSFRVPTIGNSRLDPLFIEGATSCTKAGKVLTISAGNGGKTIGGDIEATKNRKSKVEHSRDLTLPFMKEFLQNPKIHPRALSVQSYSRDGKVLSSFSEMPGIDGGTDITLGAPGEDIFMNAFPSKFVSGTSFSAPLLSGALACLMSAVPNTTVIKAREAFLATAERQNPKEIYGRGIINVEKALEWIRKSK